MSLMTSISDPKSCQEGNASLAKQVLEEVIAQGVTEFCLCPGARNAPLVYPLVHSTQVKIYYWPEERSAAFFALGRIKATSRPVAVVTTSGTAAAELLPAVMEAYYTGLPLVLITADRPRRFRGTGAPQSVEQVGLFHCYAREVLDLEAYDRCDLSAWRRQGPLHLNVCLEEPKDAECQTIRLDPCQTVTHQESIHFSSDETYLEFLESERYPLVVVGALHPTQREKCVEALRHLNAPIYAEACSGLREEPRLQHLQITRIENIWQFAADHGYPIDSILRFGGIPTARLWRDIEHKGGDIHVCSISDVPFSGLSCAGVSTVHLNAFFDWAKTDQVTSQLSFFQMENGR